MLSGVHKLDAERQHSPSGGRRFSSQLLKWIGNKQRFASEIVSFFPARYGTYHEPFLGSGAVLGTLAPTRAVASDALAPLIEIWEAVARHPDMAKQWYHARWQAATSVAKGC